MATPVEITYRVVGADQVAGALTQMENRARQMSSAMTGAMAPARQAVSALSSALSSTATILRLTGAEGQALAGHLEVATLAISATAVAVQTLRGATLAWTGAMVAAQAAVTTLTVGLAAVVAAAAPIAAAIAIIIGVLAIGAGMVSQFAGATQELVGAQASLAKVSLALTQPTERQLTLQGQSVETIQRLAEATKRQTDAAKRQADAQAKLADAIRETRIQGELNLIVSTITAERARDIENSLRRQAEFLREAAQAAAERFRLEQETADLIRLANEQTIQAIEDAQRERLEETRRILAETLRLEQETADLIRLANQQAIEAIEEEERERFRLGQELLVGAFAVLQRTLSENLTKIRNMFVEKFGALGPLIFQAIQGIGDAVGNLFGDLVRGAKSFGESLADFFKGIAESILNVFQRLVANAAVSWILSLILPGLGGFRSIFKMLTGFAQGGIVSGGLTPIMAAQAGTVVSRPTLAMIGEGGEREAVVPEHLWPVFRGSQQEQRRPREAVIHLTIHNVIGDPRALGIMTAGDVAGVIVNDVSRRGPTIQAIRVALS